jgi:hypothetical protein
LAKSAEGARKRWGEKKEKDEILLTVSEYEASG